MATTGTSLARFAGVDDSLNPVPGEWVPCHVAPRLCVRLRVHHGPMPSLTICIDCGRSTDPELVKRSRCPACLAGWKATRPRPQQSPEAAARRAEHQRVVNSHRWRKVAALVKARDGCCQSCGTTRNLTVHHTTKAREAVDPYDPDLCVTLCRSCHGRLEGRR